MDRRFRPTYRTPQAAHEALTEHLKAPFHLHQLAEALQRALQLQSEGQETLVTHCELSTMS